MLGVLFHFLEGAIVALNFSGLGFTLFLDVISPKKQNLHTSEIAFIIIYFVYLVLIYLSVYV